MRFAERFVWNGQSRGCLVAGGVAAVLLQIAEAAAPPDKSGVKPSVISLPSGAGSIEGLGESFEPQLNTGGSSYGVTIAVPPGRAALAPSIRLAYNSFAGNGIAGVGWTLEFASVKRQTDKGFPEYDAGDTFVFGGEELVPLSNAEHDWRCENERSFERLRQIDSDNDGVPDAWEVTERNGTRHTLGRFRGQNNRWSVVEHPEKPEAAPLDRTYAWMVDTTTDLHGNRIEYEYIRGSGVLYPSRITYAHLGNQFHEILFQYEARPDAFDDYRPTFSARLNARLSRIEVRSQGQLVRAYNFAYSYEPGDLTAAEAALQSTYLDLGVTLLKRVVQVDRSGNDANHLPPLVFTYSGLDLTKAEQRDFTAPPELDLAEPNGRVQLADLDGDALPDLFATTAEGATKVQRVALNRGESRLSGQPKLTFAPARLVLGSSPVDLAEPNTVVHDPKGKGLVDMSSLQDDGSNKRLETFGNRARLDEVDEDRLGFSQENLEATTLANPPAFVTYSQAGTRQMDVNFDKRGDFVNLEPGFGAMTVNTFFIDRSGNWIAGESTLPPSYPLANTFQDSEGNPSPCVHLADMNGDRMLDLVCLAASPSGAGLRIRVSYWPLCGRGRYADERSMPTTEPDTFEIANADLRDVFVDDITGDGLADILVLDGSGPETVLSLRVNIAGQHWSPPYTRTGLPRYAPRDPTNPTIVRLADLNANGSLDILFRNTAPADTWAYVELLPQGAPSLMVGIDNGIGKRTAIVYGSAAEDEQWAREAGHPWRTFAPIPLQIVRQIRTTCGLDLNGDGKEDTLVTEFRYRDPYYDGFEREFRGFTYAQRVTYGDDWVFDPETGRMGVSSGWDPAKTPTGQVSGPSAVARYRFYTGAADQQDNDDYVGEPPAGRLIDEITERGGREEEPLKGLQRVEEQVDPVVLHSSAAADGGFDAGCEAAALATTPEGQSRLTPDAYVYARLHQDWIIRRLYRPAEALPYFADQNSDGILEDYRSTPAVPIPEGRFAGAGITVLSGSGRSVTFVFASRQTTELIEANGLLAAALGHPLAPAARTVTTYDYDNYGNQTVMRSLGREEPGFDDERVVTTTYALSGNALGLWVIDKPDTVTTTDETGAFVSKQEFYYDGDPFVGLAGQIQNRALLSRRVEYVDSQQTLQAVRTRYDSFGNIVETRDPVGNRRLVGWDTAFQLYPVSETIVVGGAGPDLVITAEYDAGLGVMTRSVDFNGGATSYLYDSYGRLVATIRPGDTAEFPTTRHDYQPADPIRGRAFTYDPAGHLTILAVPLGAANRVTTRQREQSGQAGEYITVTYTDGTGRSLATVEEGEQADTWVVRQATSYNLRGLVQAEWLPYQVSSVGVPQFPSLWPSGRPPQSDGVNPAVVATDFYYDAQGRQLRTLAPPETWGGPRRETRTHHLPFQQWILDEEDLRAGSPQADTPRIEYSDGLGRLIAVEETVRLTDTGEPGPPVRWRTEYRYDLNDQVIETKDSQNNIKRMTYDALKRMTLLEDPDRGRIVFAYDDASNLRETIDAKGQRVTYTYDGANRILTENYHDAGTNDADVQFVYDLPATNLDLGDGTRGDARNTRGQIASVRDTSGETHFSYDSRARIEWEVKRIRDASRLISYRTRFAYDDADRLALLTFPDGDEARYTYNSRNLLSRIHGASLGDVVASIGYRPSGQLDQILYGNGVRTHYAYDPRLRLTEIQTGKATGPDLIDLAYTYDGLANVTRIDDQRDLAGQPEAVQRYNTQTFSYDSLFRLIRVEYPTLGTTTARHIAYRFDRIGNLLAQTSDITHLEGGREVVNLGEMTSGGSLGRSGRGPRQPQDPPGPHALTATPDRAYQYDPNGNNIALDGLALTWDFKDRLVVAENEQMRAEYAYDYLSRRVLKTVHWKQPGPADGDQPSELDPAWRKTTTHYVNRHFEVREHDAAVKYLWNQQTRVARVTTSLAATTRTQRLRLQPGWNLVCAAVSGQFPVLDPANNADLAACFRFADAAPESGWDAVTATTTISAGTTLWVYARQATTLVLTGEAGPSSLPALTGQGQFVGNVLGEPFDFGSLVPAAWFARFDAADQAWAYRFPDSQGAGALTPGAFVVAPGGVFWATGASSGSLSQAVEPLQVRYYHQDHLASTSVVTDRDGAVVEESSNYPFGHPRHQYQPRGLVSEPYQFAQKERDAESGLHYFEARYLASVAGRFISVDPIWTLDMKGLGRLPQNLNPYAYAHNNPLKYIDPMGLEVTVTTKEDEKSGEKTTAIKLTGAIIDETGDMSTGDLKKVQARIVKQLKSDFKGSDSGEKHSWNITVDIRVVKKESDIKAKDHVIRIVDSMPDHEEGVLGAVNEIGGKEVRIKAKLIPRKPSDPGNASLERTASHEIGHAFGLRHDTDPDNPVRATMQPRNLMRQTVNTDGHQIDVHQIREMQKLYDDKKLNQ